MPVQIQLRHDTAANWTAANPTLALGEAGVETDTSQLKFGDGSTAWTGLGYFGADLSSHTGDTTDAHDASAVSFDPTGLTYITGTEVQTALEELDAAVGTGGGGVVVQDEGSPLATTATTLNFVGAGVAATGAGATKTITIAGGGGSATAEVNAAGRIYAFTNFR